MQSAIFMSNINWNQKRLKQKEALNVSEILKKMLQAIPQSAESKKKAENVEHFDDYFAINLEFKHAKI